MNNNFYAEGGEFLPSLDSIDQDRYTSLLAWKETIIELAHHYRLDVSEENVNIIALWHKDLSEDEVIKLMAKRAGFALKKTDIAQFRFNNWVLPVVVSMKDGKVALVKTLEGDDGFLVSFPEDRGLLTPLSREEIFSAGNTVYTLRPIKHSPDPRVDDYIKPREKHWIWRIVFRNMKPYYIVILAALFINLLGLAGITYSMQTYDRVIPAQSWPTMWVLFAGVSLAFVFDFVLRLMRYGVIDILGKRADLRISDRVFGHALRIKNGHRPQSTGTFISQIRELEQVREMITSSTVVAIADLPFFFLFLFIIYMIGGIVFLVPLGGMVLMVLPGLLTQKKLARLARASMRESTLRSAMLVEVVQGMDDIKYLQAEYRFQQQWLHYTSTTAESSLELKHLTHKLTCWSYTIQNAVFVCVVLVGTPFAMTGDLSTGALVASSILSSRMMAPISQIAGLLTRWQQTKVAIAGLDSIMDLPTDHPENVKRVHKAALSGNYKLSDAVFRHHAASRQVALSVSHLQIKAGERIAILGRNGSGKSSLLNALAGTMIHESGSLTLDDIRMDNIDPADLRRDIGYLSQKSRLFFGSIRENLMLGMPLASDQELLEVITRTGAIDFINTLPDGLDHQLMEGGLGLSGGQQQILLLSRLMLRSPDIILLDEPTASLDDVTEQAFVENMQPWLTGRTFIVATHRKKILELVDRIIVISDGRIVLDSPRDQMMSSL